MNQSCLSRAKVRVNSRTTNRWGKLSCLKLSPPVQEVQQEEKIPGSEGGLWGPREFKSMYVTGGTSLDCEVPLAPAAAYAGAVRFGSTCANLQLQDE